MHPNPPTDMENNDNNTSKADPKMQPPPEPNIYHHHQAANLPMMVSPKAENNNLYKNQGT